MNNLATTQEIEYTSSLDLVNRYNKRHDSIIKAIKKVVAGGIGEYHIDYEYFENNLGLPAKRTFYKVCPAVVDALDIKYKCGIVMSYGESEKIALNTIEQVLGVKLIRQYPVLNYRIDGYDPVNNIAYEIDEPEHKYQVVDDMIRQRRIENELGCKFVRIKV